jgi:hypothetical protein
MHRSPTRSHSHSHSHDSLPAAYMILAVPRCNWLAGLILTGSTTFFGDCRIAIASPTSPNRPFRIALLTTCICVPASRRILHCSPRPAHDSLSDTSHHDSSATPTRMYPSHHIQYRFTTTHELVMWSAPIILDSTTAMELHHAHVLAVAHQLQPYVLLDNTPYRPYSITHGLTASIPYDLITSLFHSCFCACELRRVVSD